MKRYDRWWSIDSAPKDGTEIDLWCDGKRRVNCFYQDNNWHIHNGKVILNPSYWMPLPQPPENF